MTSAMLYRLGVRRALGSLREMAVLDVPMSQMDMSPGSAGRGMALIVNFFLQMFEVRLKSGTTDGLYLALIQITA
ncbi:hypothetical protein HX867_01690 [Pseudomonas gingeri]|uniref:hypothetical protein n=1 Tax=Pseudomonas gingeri TaxID=117681 RepID=UPI0015A1C15C|nr:hypothetical protein [Pseudomonas gingeri]NVZ60784.1 hypothetical protein [Pseudomonas gingeri]NVZ73855.1 hypothetical protein [Pseudomonas gingeri]